MAPGVKRVRARGLFLWLVLALPAFAGQARFELREHIGVHWVNELVSFPFTAPAGTCHPRSVQLTGPDGPVAVQLSEIEAWPDDGSVRAAKVSFVVAALPALGRQTFTLDYGPTPAAAPPVTDLSISPTRDQLELATSQFAIRLPRGERRYEPAARPAEVPGPVSALRLADGTWFGGSGLYGVRSVTGYAAQLVEQGPVFARATMSYAFDDGTRMELSVRLIAGDCKVTWHMNVQEGRTLRADRSSRTAAQGGWRLDLSRGLDPLLGVLAPEHNDDHRWGKREFTPDGGWVFSPEDVELRLEPAGTITSLVPWEDWWNSSTQAQWRFKTPSRGEILRVAAVDPAVWVTPGDEGEQLKWTSLANREKWIPLVRGEDGSVYMEINTAAGERRWQLGGPGRTPRADASRLNEQAAHTWTMPGAQVGAGHRLDAVKDYVLAWPGPAAPAHPRLFSTREDIAAARPTFSVEEIAALRERGRVRPSGRRRSGAFGPSDADALAAYLATGSAEVARETHVVGRLARQLALLGNFDLMRHTKVIVTGYDGLIDSDVVAPEQRAVLRAQLAYLGYVLADPSTWSVERGYCSANLNMSILYILNLGLVACALPEHPLAREWVRPAVAMCERWLGENVGPAGEWPESVANYAHVSATGLLMFAVAARNAGLHDFIDDPRMKRLMLYLAKQYTPPDPRSGGERPPGLSLLPPSGRSAAGKARVIPGLMARATAATDPAYSRVQQWNWVRSGSSLFAGASATGIERFAVDRSLPAAAPDWGSELFPQVGAILRQGVGTRDEWYVNLMVPSFSNDWVPSEYGAVAAIFAHGVPVAGAFAGGYAEKEELFMSRVHLARERGSDDARRERFYHRGERALADFSALPRQDYLAADLTIDQPVYRSLEAGANSRMLPAPEWPAVPRAGRGPVQWRRQVLFVKGDHAHQAGYLLLRDTVSGGQPTMWQMWTVSEKIGPSAAAGELEAFLSDKPGPRSAPARALPGDRFTAVGPFGVDTEFFVASPTETPRHTLRWGTTYAYSPVEGFAEYMDLLHLQMPGDGAYQVVMFPRRRETPAPAFDSLADGRLIRVRGDFGTDYAFLAESEQGARHGGVAFRGTAGSVQQRDGTVILALGARGEVRCGELGLVADGAASVRVTSDGMIVDVPPAPARSVKLAAPGEWSLVSVGPMPVATEGDALTLRFGPGVNRATLRRK